MDDEIPYLLLTPGPLTTSRSVRQAMMRDYCTWDSDYNRLVSEIRERLLRLATSRSDYTSVLMQGSGTFAVESLIGSVVPAAGKMLIVNNGAYGQRMVQIAQRLRIDCRELAVAETEPADAARIADELHRDRAITHVAVVHCETTTGLQKPVEEIGRVVAEQQRQLIVDAMSSFGGIPLSMEQLSADYLVSSSNKCIQGTPGFGFVIARRDRLEEAAGRARSLSLDLYDQWREMELHQGKWRYTSPTHVVRAFRQALDELDSEGGIAARHRRYSENQRLLHLGMRELGFQPLLPRALQSPVITAFRYPEDARFSFPAFYRALKRRRFVIYPGKVSTADTFRIGTIGHVFPDDIRLLLRMIAQTVEELGFSPRCHPT
jgi:2-aminoethylphosphonate-pyruvate transaminase